MQIAKLYNLWIVFFFAKKFTLQNKIFILDAMKQILIFIFIGFASIGYSQNYIDFYRNTIWANIHANKGNNDSTIIYLEKAFTDIPDKSNFNFIVYLLSLKNIRHDTDILDFVAAIKCKLDSNLVKAEIMENDSAEKLFAIWNAVKTTCSNSTIKANEEAKDMLYINEITSMIAIDQKYRNDSILSLNKALCDSIDSLNFIKLHRLFERNGFIKLHGEAMANRVTLLYHIDDYNNFIKVKQMLKKAVKNGCLHPSNYAYALDRSRIASNLKPKYYWFIPDSELEQNNIPSKSKINTVNKERKKIGLPPYPFWSGLWF